MVNKHAKCLIENMKLLRFFKKSFFDSGVLLLVHKSTLALSVRHWLKQ